MSPQRIVLLFVFFIIILKVEASFSTSNFVKTRRTQSMRPLVSHKTKSNPNTQAQSSSHSSSASDTSLTEIKSTDPQPIPSTSSVKRISSMDLKEVDLRPLSEQTKHVNFINSVNLNEASAQTHSEGGQINPTRDGVFSRVRSAFLRFGTAAVAGTAIGAGSTVIDQRFIHNVNGTQVKSENVSTSTSVDEINRI